MENNELIEINVSKLIPAKKWRVIRLLTKVNEFPGYMPNVKEVTVLEKIHNTIKTKWKIQVDSIPMSWTEVDTLNLTHNQILFKASEGDLHEFKGSWKFQDDPQGTLVTVNVSLKVDIPAIKEFAESYIKKLLTKNFEAMLEAIEKKIISLRYDSYKHGNIDKVAGFGIIAHPYDFSHLEKCFKTLNPNFNVSSPEFVSQLFHVSPSFKLYDINDFRSRTGESVNGSFMIATFIPDMMEKDIWSVFSKVVRACKIAEKHGIGIVTLGGFTSIVAERIGQEISREVDIAVTSGNTYTAAMAIDGVLKAADLVNLDISKSTLAIIGGTGDIGSACARFFTDTVKNLVITGRTKSHLSKLSAELKKKKKARVTISLDNKKAVEGADIIISAASATAPILQVEWFKPGAIICDVGYPKNISHAPTQRNDIFVFSGGLAKSPTPIAFPLDFGLPSPHVIYGCFAEGIILALEKRFENYSFGRGNITIEKIEEIRNLGKKHGFEVADFYWGDTLIDNQLIERMQSIIHENKTHLTKKTG
ncbi:MAG: SRPBCC family protein [Candidatus Omnitrophota bacterium]|jgi:predicted amino acid dehydrogenase/ribosome-associated toxin RatA of RatAB toxin-antitoxin module